MSVNTGSVVCAREQIMPSEGSEGREGGTCGYKCIETRHGRVCVVSTSQRDLINSILKGTEGHLNCSLEVL
jgi:hypothetical protein